VVVVGLGVLGQLSAQFLRANGCRVIGVDPDPARVALARSLGMDEGLDPKEASYVQRVQQLTDGFGADAVVVTAAGGSDEIISLAFNAARKKGRVILVGDVGLDLKRGDIYAKELDFLVSCSYGPGRYDPVYEAGGQDYPLPYVRWTENRNMAAYLDLIARGRIDVAPLIETVYPVARAGEAFDSLKAEGPKPLSVILEYPQDPAAAASRTVRLAGASPARARTGALRVGVLGAGSFVQGMHLPNMAKLRDAFTLRAVMGRTGTNAKAVATQYEAAYATTDAAEILADPEIDVVVIGTRHDLHADLTLRALQAGKHVLVEKPLALTATGLEAIEAFYAANPTGPVLLTGFNRRFAPGVASIRDALARRTSPLIANYRMNAGHIPLDHWVHGPEGGGRNIGEACHVYDLFVSLTGARPTMVQAQSIAPGSAHWARNDNFVATVGFTDGSVCTLTYTALGAKDHPKERMDIYAGGMVLSLDDYKSTAVSGAKLRTWSAPAADKGHKAMLAAFAASLDSGVWAVSLEEQLAAMRISLEVERMINPSAAWADSAA
jgi:predicted dehydrogenase